jgi:hypothetical protein
MQTMRLLLSALAGLVACAAGLTLLWFELIVWNKSRPSVMGIGGLLALGGFGWAVNRVMVAFGALEEDAPPAATQPQAPPTDRKVLPAASEGDQPAPDAGFQRIPARKKLWMKAR